MKYYYIAQAYGSGNYGESTYTGESTTAGGGTTSGAGGNTGAGTGPNGDLANTGIYVLAIVSLACFLIFLALVVRLIRHKRHAKRTDLPAVIPGEHPVDTPQQPIAPADNDNGDTVVPTQSAAPEAERPQQPPKRIDF